MAKRRVYKITSIARAKAAALKYRSAKKKTSRTSRNGLTMAKRNLRVVEWVRTVPAIGICTLCSSQFKVPATAMKRVAARKRVSGFKFTEHKCKPESLN